MGSAGAVGQDHVLQALTNALSHDRLHHAYLFTGTRGVGKTTLTRIFAKSLNCETGVTATPCGECSACCQIDKGSFVDLIEIDAASRTKVEDTRELLDSVQYVPHRGRYKVYVIDEVHMLSGHSFNALLKTLEEPPQHTKFLLATTDPQKITRALLSFSIPGRSRIRWTSPKWNRSASGNASTAPKVSRCRAVQALALGWVCTFAELLYRLIGARLASIALLARVLHAPEPIHELCFALPTGLWRLCRGCNRPAHACLSRSLRGSSQRRG